MMNPGWYEAIKKCKCTDVEFCDNCCNLKDSCVKIGRYKGTDKSNTNKSQRGDK